MDSVLILVNPSSPIHLEFDRNSLGGESTRLLQVQADNHPGSVICKEQPGNSSCLCSAHNENQSFGPRSRIGGDELYRPDNCVVYCQRKGTASQKRVRRTALLEC